MLLVVSKHILGKMTKEQSNKKSSLFLPHPCCMHLTKCTSWLTSAICHLVEDKESVTSAARERCSKSRTAGVHRARGAGPSRSAMLITAHGFIN